MKSASSRILLLLITFLALTPGIPKNAAAAAGDRLTISRTDVNVRSGPTLQDTVIMVVNPGETIVEIDVSGDWYLVELPDRNQRGWIYGQLVDNRVTAEPQTSAAAPQGEDPAALTARLNENVARLNRRAERSPLGEDPNSLTSRLNERAGPSSPRQNPNTLTSRLNSNVAGSERSYFDGDPANGERVFYKCGACHATDRGVNTIGPSLWGIIGSVPAQVPGFGYSAGMRRFAANGAVWDEATLEEFIRRPPRLVRGTSMPFSGIREEKDRRDLIAYLKKLDR